MNRLPFTDVQEHAKRDAAVICARWLPNGKRQGVWWVVATPWREDRNPSLGVSLTSGKWRDFATGEKGDFVDLAQRLGLARDRVSALRAVARMVGHPFGDEK